MPYSVQPHRLGYVVINSAGNEVRKFSDWGKAAVFAMQKNSKLKGTKAGRKKHGKKSILRFF